MRAVYSPLDALAIARAAPGREVVFFAVGFETTAPANAMAAFQARPEGLRNFSLLVSHVLVPPAMRAILAAPDNRVQGFLAAGHVCAVMGYAEYEALAAAHRVPIVVTGFEPLDILEGALRCVRLLEAGEAAVENQYVRSVRREGNAAAQAMMRAVFRVTGRRWRGMGALAESGLALAPEYDAWNAEMRFGPVTAAAEADTGCISDRVLRGVARPTECPAFCELLGIDPLHVACEGRFLAFVAPEAAEAALGVLRGHDVSAGAARIGTVTEGPAGQVSCRGPLGVARVIDMLSGEVLPRIC